MSIKSQINDFLLTGQFTNNIDEFGNEEPYIDRLKRTWMAKENTPGCKPENVQPDWPPP